jgi:hypothetical protein
LIEAMRQAFQRVLGITPVAYRKGFSSAQASVPDCDES